MGDHKVEVFMSEDGEWYWRRKAANGEIVATSSEGYTHKESAVESAKSNFPDDTLDVEAS